MSFVCRKTKTSDVRDVTCNEGTVVSTDELCLQVSDVGVQYKNSDHLLRAKVHSVKNQAINKFLSLRRPLDAFDPNCLFVYGTNKKKQLMSTWIL